MEDQLSIEPSTTLLSLDWNKATNSATFEISVWLVVAAVVVAILVFFWQFSIKGWSFRKFEIDQAEIGIGKNKFRFSPNSIDRQVAYSIWVELSTRKIGLPIDLEDDVVVEIYDSWFNFFTVTRELVKDIPVNRVKRDSTQAIIKLSIEVLNEGLRPHLTQWQARFRRWYERELKRYDEERGEGMIDPQEIQKNFPKYEELSADLNRVNLSLIKYRAKMHQLVLKE